MGWVAGRLATVEVVIVTTYFQAGAHRTRVERERKRGAKVFAVQRCLLGKGSRLQEEQVGEVEAGGRNPCVRLRC